MDALTPTLTVVPRVVPLVSLGSPEGAIVWPPPTPVRQRAKEKKSASGAPGAEAAESENSEDAESPEELPVGIQDQVLARAEALQQLVESDGCFDPNADSGAQGCSSCVAWVS